MAQLRLSNNLMKKAAKEVKLSYRSVPKQIEFWANIGQQVEAKMTPADLVALAAGEIEIVRKKSSPVAMEDVFAKLESDRRDGSLAAKIAADRVWYEESEEHPGHLVRVDIASGERTMGLFKAGVFHLLDEAKGRAKIRNK